VRFWEGVISLEKRFTKEGVFQRHIASLNRHLPKKRKSLSDLLREEKPFVVGRDGKSQRIKKEELRVISELLDESTSEQLMLPILIELSEYGARISGSTEASVVMKVLEKEEDVFDKKDDLFIYKPEVQQLRKILPTATQYCFVTRS
jgi:uncharacterized protein (UPF0216 family)